MAPPVPFDFAGFAGDTAARAIPVSFRSNDSSSLSHSVSRARALNLAVCFSLVFAMTAISLDHEYILYIDEAGDPGLSKVRPIDPQGSSEWFVLGGVLIRVSNEKNVVRWVRDIRSEIGSHQGPALHFRKLTEPKKLTVCSRLASQPVRAFVLCSNKKNMRRHQNPRASKIPSQEWFHNWCIRLLLERVSDWCHERSMFEHQEARKARVVFSTRGGHSYPQTNAYYQYIKQRGQSAPLYLNKRTIKWDVIDWDLMESAQPSEVAGLQLADIVASAFYQAAETSGPRWSLDHAKALNPIVATLRNTKRDQGVTLWPYDIRKAQLTDQQKQIFRFYGYRL